MHVRGSHASRQAVQGINASWRPGAAGVRPGHHAHGCVPQRAHPHLHRHRPVRTHPCSATASCPPLPLPVLGCVCATRCKGRRLQGGHQACPEFRPHGQVPGAAQRQQSLRQAWCTPALRLVSANDACARRVDEAVELVKERARAHGAMQADALNSVVRALAPASILRALRMRSLVRTLGLPVFADTDAVLAGAAARAGLSAEAAALYWCAARRACA